MRVELTVNGETRALEVEPRMSLHCLRERLCSTERAGASTACGACTVLIDGAPARACLMSAVQADGYAITTIEGLTPGPANSPIQDARETHGMQCGYCTPAMILTAHALLPATLHRRGRRSSMRFQPIFAAARAMHKSSKRSRLQPNACAA
jgi:carbon-monoxide dehydrogenase small subunit